MGAASFPILDKLLIIGTDLVKSSKGDPPLLKSGYWNFYSSNIWS